jgi:hypothetical protein
VFAQLWNRVYRPYLQFLYLNNSYHFYAPEPGPATFLLFHVAYENDKGDVVYSWVESPAINEKTGMPDFPFALQFQRRLAMNDHIQYYEQNLPPPLLVVSPGKSIQNPIYYWRQMCSPDPPEVTPENMHFTGKLYKAKIPYHPHINPQYKVPTFPTQKVIRSYALHVFMKPHKQKPEYKPVSVRVYKMIHAFPTDTMIANGGDPTNPVLYQPYYQGKFGVAQLAGQKEAQFQLLDEPKFTKDGDLISGDPLLYWLLPILPVSPGDPVNTDVAIKGFHFYHAGDKKCVWYPGERSPQEEK